MTLLWRWFNSRQYLSLAVEPVSPCYPVRQDPPPPHPLSYSVAQPCCGKEIARERWVIRKRHSSLSPHLLISGPDNSPLLLAEWHVCPPLPTAEICLWCKHPCLSPWQPSLLPAVGCHASRLPLALPHPLALYCRWHVRALYITLRRPSGYLVSRSCCVALLSRSRWFPV